MVARFDSSPSMAKPKANLPHNWEERARAFGPGLTIVHTAQCPYIASAARDILALAKERGIETRTVELKTARAVQQQSPSAHGIFGLVLDGQLLTYQPVSRKNFDKLLREKAKGA